ncbi:MAG: YceD family protein [Bacilli bacterium]
MMIIDLKKLIYCNSYKYEISEEIEIDKSCLINTEIKRISPVKVSGFIALVEDEYELNLRIKGVMILSCARTLKDVEYPFDLSINEIIGENSDNSLEITQNRVDIFPIIWQYILMDVPLRVLHSTANCIKTEGDGWRLTDENEKKETIDPRLSKLSEYLKE